MRPPSVPSIASIGANLINAAQYCGGVTQRRQLTLGRCIPMSQFALRSYGTARLYFVRSGDAVRGVLSSSLRMVCVPSPTNKTQWYFICTR